MKIPHSKEEFLVWPPLGAGLAIFIGATIWTVISYYHHVLSQNEGMYWYAGYLFPIVMAFSFALRLHGKYWLGFSWFAVLCYLLTLPLAIFHVTDTLASVFLVLVCVFIMSAFQAGLLYLKRISIHSLDP